jgi:DNA-binding CsgD family transcriptional regulator
MRDIHPYTTVREDLIANAPRAAPGLIPPPYHTYDVRMLYLLCRFDLAAARAALPPPLELNDQGLGVIMVVDVPRGWVIAPFTALVTTLQVKGFDGPDQYPGNYIHTAFYSNTCGDIFHKVYNDRITAGHARLESDGDRLLGTAGRDGSDTLQVSARRTDRVSRELVGMNRYLSSLGNTIQVFSTSYSAAFRDIEDVTIEIFDTAPERLRNLKPLEVVWPLLIEGMQLTFNPTYTLGTEAATVPADAALAALFDLVSRFRRPAVIIGASGRPLFVSLEAMALLGEGGRTLAVSSKLLGAGPGAKGRRLDEPVLLERDQGGPLLAQVLPVAKALGDGLRLVLFTDPRAGGQGDPEPVLHLLGLTPTEARLAVRVGRGASPQEAGPGLGMTATTARSTLRSIYAKLEVSRQAQLARLVTQLETV